MRAARAMAMFGVDAAVDLAALEALRGRCAGVAGEIDERLGAGEVALVMGASGSGKSTVLEALAERVRGRGEQVVVCQADGGCCGTPIIERLGRDVPEAMRALGAAGLSEARLLGRREAELSAGQRARFRLALAMDRARRAMREVGRQGQCGAGERAPVTLLVDEFGSGLDDATARCLGHSFGRWVRAAGGCSPGIRAVVGAARADVGALAPDVVVSMDAEEEVEVGASRGARDGSALESDESASRGQLAINIEPGVMADYAALAHYHYAADRPGPVCQVLRAFDDASGALAGVLVVCRPTLNARWRRLAWPGDYEDCDLRARALRLNAEVRVISRVIVDPRFRACGVGTRLVRAYLASPLTVRTEAVSAMGQVCPVFERAGMTPIRMAQRPQDGRLERFLARRGVAPESLVDRADELWRDSEAHDELRMWANAARGTRRLMEGSAQELCRHAARAVLAEPVAYCGQSSKLKVESSNRRRKSETSSEHLNFEL